MQIKLFGMKARAELLCIILLLGLYIGSTLLCNCMRYEGMTNMNSASNSAELAGSYMTDHTPSESGYKSALQRLAGNKGGPVPLPKGEKLIFATDKSSPSCCPSTYSTSTGCVCATDEQMMYLNERGGNRTYATSF